MTDAKVLRAKHLKSGDTLPNLRVKLLEDGDSFNLDGYTVTVKLRKAEADTAAVDASATVEAAGRGLVTYDWQSGDTDTAGTYQLELVADDGTDSISFPNRGYTYIYIEDGI